MSKKQKNKKVEIQNPKVETPVTSVTPVVVAEPAVMVAGQPIKTLEPKVLAARIGITPKRLRAILREKYPRTSEARGTRWNIPADLAKKVETDYRKAKEIREAEKKAEIQAELNGEDPKAKGKTETVIKSEDDGEGTMPSDIVVLVEAPEAKPEEVPVEEEEGEPVTA